MRPRSRIAFLLPYAAVATALVPARADAQQDATTQCIAASEQGLDLRKQEKLLDARKVLAVCATTRCPEEIKTTCEQRIAEINAALPGVVFEVKDGQGNDVPSVKVTVDGVLSSTPIGRATPLDPGTHVFVFEAPGQPSLQKQLVVHEGERERHERVVLGMAEVPAPAPPETTVAVTPAAPAPAPAAPAPASSGGGTQRTVGVVLGAAGLAGVVIGGVFGIVASSKWSSAKTDCGSGCAADSVAQKEKSDASTAATISTLGFAGGAALVAAGLAVFFTAPSGAKATALHVVPAAGPGGGTLLLQGEF